MQQLRPFQPQLPMRLHADLSIDGSILRFEYQLDLSGSRILGLPLQSQDWSRDLLSRKDNLWMSTCFEAFLQPVGTNVYYELNFSLTPAWNAYQFQSYRNPQPPAVTKQLAVTSMLWDADDCRLQVEVESTLKENRFQVGLTAVIEDDSNKKHYYALAHPSERADFHTSQSFLLSKGKPS